LRFTAPTGQASGFSPLHFVSANGTRVAAGLTPSAMATDGRIFVLGSQPLLEQVTTTNGQRTLNLYGKIGVTYRLEYTTNLAAGGSWTLRGTATLTTNYFRTVPVGNSPAPPVFYRAR